MTSGTGPFAPYLEARGYLLLDGGLATALERRGHDLRDPLWSALLLLENPDEVRAVHSAYLDAGADCIATASYQATVEGLRRRGLEQAEAEAVLVSSVRLAVEAVDAFVAGSGAGPGERPLVAASVGPYGAWLADGSEYDGRYGLSESGLRDFHADRFALLAGSGADVLACETLPSVLEARALLDLLEATPAVWAWFSFSCRDEGHLWDGTPVEEVAALFPGRPRVAGVGVNCIDPRLAGPLVARIRSHVDVPVVVYPNSGERYDPVAKRWLPTGRGPEDDEGAGAGSGGMPEAGSRPGARSWMEGIGDAWTAGARVVGGCCRTGPEQIARLRSRLERGDFAA